MLLHADGFDTALVYEDKWSSSAPSFGNSPTTGGRTGSKRLYTQFPNQPRALYYSIGANKTTLIMGAAVKADNTADAGNVFGGFLDSGTIQVFILMDNSGIIRAYRGGYGTLLGSSAPGVWAISVWHYIECKATFSNTVGTIEVKVDGATVLNLTGVDNCTSANEYANQYGIGDISNTHHHNAGFDDVYLCDTVDSGVTGAPNDDFLGDIAIETIFPNGNGNSSDFTGQDADSTDNYLNVDETPPDQDTTYNESAVVGDKDTYAYGDLATVVGPVLAVQTQPRATKTAAGVRAIKSVARLGVVEDDGPEQFLAGGYQTFPDIREANPDGDQWTIADVNSAEFGVKVTT